jgi:hypothetical protein
MGRCFRIDVQRHDISFDESNLLRFFGWNRDCYNSNGKTAIEQDDLAAYSHSLTGRGLFS